VVASLEQTSAQVIAEAIAQASAARPADLASCTPALDIAAQEQQHLPLRLFQS
jgi:urease accessory protein UreF